MQSWWWCNRNRDNMGPFNVLGWLMSSFLSFWRPKLLPSLCSASLSNCQCLPYDFKCRFWLHYTLHLCVLSFNLLPRQFRYFNYNFNFSGSQRFKLFLSVTFAQNFPTRMWMKILSLMFHTPAGLLAECTESFRLTGFVWNTKWNMFVTWEVWLNLTVAHFCLSALQF